MSRVGVWRRLKMRAHLSVDASQSTAGGWGVAATDSVSETSIADFQVRRIALIPNRSEGKEADEPGIGSGGPLGTRR